MKYSSYLFPTLVGFLLFTTSCLKDQCKRMVTYTKYEPIYKNVNEVRVLPTVEAPRELENPGKIYIYGSTLLINERLEGVHVIDNSNPAAPVPKAFINIPGNIDIAMRGNILYADNYMDLLSIDISDLQNIVLTKRVQDVFPIYGSDPQKGLIVAYNEVEVTEEVDCNNEVWSDPRFSNGGGIQPTSSGGFSGGGRQAVATGGSMARFAISNQSLYIVDNASLHVYDIADAAMPNYIHRAELGRGIETIFPYRNRLFIGSTSGMLIYDNSNPHHPRYLSDFQHATACDPVFVEGDFAYVTLRGGTPCGSFNNQLDIIDISNIYEPSLVSSTPTTHPHGLSIDNRNLYLCDGDAGLRVFDIQDKQNLTELFHKADVPAYDVIHLPNTPVVMVVGKDGFYQYNTSNPNNLELLSHIEVKQN